VNKGNESKAQREEVDKDDCAGHSGGADKDERILPLRPPLSLLREHFDIPWFFAGMAVQAVNLWMGNAGTEPRAGASSNSSGPSTNHQHHLSQLHHDASHNLYVLLTGRKTLTIFPPQDKPFLYVGSRQWSQQLQPALFSQIPSTDALEVEMERHQKAQLAADAANRGRDSSSSCPDSNNSMPSLLSSFPLYPYARRTVVEFSAGDMLYLPPGWFHEVKSHGKHAAINFWARNTARAEG
jgi:hypothetical protein